MKLRNPSPPPVQNYRHTGYIHPQWHDVNPRVRLQHPQSWEETQNLFRAPVCRLAGLLWMNQLQLLQLPSAQVVCPPFWLPVMGTSCGSFFFWGFQARGGRGQVPLHSSPIIHFCLLVHNLHPKHVCVIYYTATAAFAAHTISLKSLWRSRG